ncbi:DNA-processing protein DprA [Methanobacterium formicicum]|uniref:DNA-processing protein DprA n=1 Tax=Methanobacterium formicicum TaxID=2162 RepID=UPI0024125159|nr:DNA-processing protein DprA [Methanobacterium formicicum]MDG3548595.1 DNA-protecting protein DprA [Methanobacterium formicicum]
MTQKKMTDFESSESNNSIEIPVDSPKYPFILKNIKNAPDVLYAIGNIDLLNKPSAAIVGTRNPTKNAIKSANKISKQYGNYGFVIVSGLAFGIDTVALKVAVSMKLPSIAVLPSPLDNVLPKKNRSLANDILKNNGLLISEYPSGTKVYKSNYINRNRIISGISMLTIVIETSAEGGTMHTIKFAKEQIRTILVADLPAEGNQKLKEESLPMISLDFIPK